MPLRMLYHSLSELTPLSPLPSLPIPLSLSLAFLLRCWQFAQRSRVCKLQYIAELERNVQGLQVEGSEVSVELEFLNQENLILSSNGSDDDADNNKGSMWTLEQKLDQPMDEEAAKLKNMKTEKVSSLS
ncbi:Putative potassium transporter [Arachis hypogaea]|nr:Putative potassium transporter [Arachis hypogaea]